MSPATETAALAAPTRLTALHQSAWGKEGGANIGPSLLVSNRTHMETNRKQQSYATNNFNLLGADYDDDECS